MKTHNDETVAQVHRLLAHSPTAHSWWPQNPRQWRDQRTYTAAQLASNTVDRVGNECTRDLDTVGAECTKRLDDASGPEWYNVRTQTRALYGATREGTRARYNAVREVFRPWYKTEDRQAYLDEGRGVCPPPLAVKI